MQSDVIEPSVYYSVVAFGKIDYFCNHENIHKNKPLHPAELVDLFLFHKQKDSNPKG